MVTKTERCSYTDYKIVPGRGTRFIARDGKLHYFISHKVRQLHTRRVKPVKLTWTQAWRAYNKKIKVEDHSKKRSRKTTRIQKAVVGMSIEEIRRRKAESREDRDKAAEVSAKEIKERKAKALQAKKADKLKQAKTGGASAASKQKQAVKKVAAPVAISKGSKR